MVPVMGSLPRLLDETVEMVFARPIPPRILHLIIIDLERSLPLLPRVRPNIDRPLSPSPLLMKLTHEKTTLLPLLGVEGRLTSKPLLRLATALKDPLPKSTMVEVLTSGLLAVLAIALESIASWPRIPGPLLDVNRTTPPPLTSYSNLGRTLETTLLIGSPMVPIEIMVRELKLVPPQKNVQLALLLTTPRIPRTSAPRVPRSIPRFRARVERAPVFRSTVLTRVTFERTSPTSRTQLPSHRPTHKRSTGSMHVSSANSDDSLAAGDELAYSYSNTGGSRAHGLCTISARYTS